MAIPESDERTALFADPDTLFSRTTDQVSVDLNGEMAILNLQTKTYFGLADVGAFIWQKLEVPTDLANLTQAVVTEFEVEVEQCNADVTAFLDRLSALSLLTVKSGK